MNTYQLNQFHNQNQINHMNPNCINRIFLAILFVAISINTFANGSINGTITSEGEPIPYANIMLKGTRMGSTSDMEGQYTIANIPDGEYVLQVSVVGFDSYSQNVSISQNETTTMDIELVSNFTQLNEIVISGTMKPTRVANSPVKIEVLSPSFFKTQATNNIFEALDNINGIQPQLSCGVCGTGCIHINGMEGAYTLIVIDGMPIMGALSSTYGLSGIPNSLIKQVEIIKGPSSTLYGTQAVGGVINVITKDPLKMPLLSTDVSYTSHDQLDASISYSPKISDKVNTLLSVNVYNNQTRIDDNGDNFTDFPLNQRISIFNKWSFQKDGHQPSTIALRYYRENRFGGVMQWTPKDKGSDQVYGEYIETKRYELIGKYNLPTSQHLWIDYSFNRHEQKSWYGNTIYNAKQHIFFSNLLWGNSVANHDWIVGLTSRIETYQDNTPSYTDDKEFIPGIFAQDEFKVTHKTSILGGIRFDHHRKHGLIVSPRLNVKQQLGKYSSARLNFGTGFRQVHLFTEDHAFLSGSRDVVIANNLKPEQSYNINLNVNHVYTMGEISGTLDVDMFYTYFTNKIIPDYETDQNLIIYDNLLGHSICRGVSLNLHGNFPFPLSLRAGATVQDIFEAIPGNAGEWVRETQKFSPVFRGTFNVEYSWDNIGLSLNWNGKVVGPQYLPTYEAPFSRPETAPWYTLQNIQMTKKFGSTVEVYAGIKNLLNYTQPTPIVDPENPFSDNFDTAYIYGPLETRRLQLGVRLNMEKR